MTNVSSLLLTLRKATFFAPAWAPSGEFFLGLVEKSGGLTEKIITFQPSMLET